MSGGAPTAHDVFGTPRRNLYNYSGGQATQNKFYETIEHESSRMYRSGNSLLDEKPLPGNVPSFADEREAFRERRLQVLPLKKRAQKEPAHLTHESAVTAAAR